LHILRNKATFFNVEELGYHSRLVTRLRTGQSGFQFLAGTRDFCFLQNVQTASGACPASFLIGARILSWGSVGQGVRLNTHVHLLVRWSCTSVPFTWHAQKQLLRVLPLPLAFHVNMPDYVVGRSKSYLTGWVTIKYYWNWVWGILWWIFEVQIMFSFLNHTVCSYALCDKCGTMPLTFLFVFGQGADDPNS
jgi:hypothetical protein